MDDELVDFLDEVSSLGEGDDGASLVDGDDGWDFDTTVSAPESVRIASKRSAPDTARQSMGCVEMGEWMELATVSQHAHVQMFSLSSRTIS